MALHSETPIVRHEKVKGRHSRLDPDLAGYLGREEAKAHGGPAQAQDTAALGKGALKRLIGCRS